MSADELDALAVEVDQAEAAEAEVVAEHEATPDVPIPAEADLGLVTVIGGVVRGVGNVICARARVSSLRGEEVTALAVAFANVAAQYDFTNLDPKSAAWIGAGIAVAGVALPRLDEYQAARAVVPEGEGASDGETR